MPIKNYPRRPLRPTPRSSSSMGGGSGSGGGGGSGSGGGSQSSSGSMGMLSSGSMSGGGGGGSGGGGGGSQMMQSSSSSCLMSSGHSSLGGGSGGGGMGSSSLSSGGGGGSSGPFGRPQPMGLGPPDVYPQDPHQKEDELTPVHVKQGFTQSYSTMVSTSDEYATAQNRVANLVSAKVLQELKSIQGKKEDSNSLGGDSSASGSSAVTAAKKRQTLNTKDHFWFVTGRNKGAVDHFFKSLASGNRPLSVMAKKVPIFNKREEVLTTLSEHAVTSIRAVWFIKMTAAYSVAMAETNKTKKRQISDPSSEWTGVIVRFLKDQLTEINSLIQSQSSSGSGPSPGSAALGLGLLDPDPNQPEKSIYFKHWTYVTDLAHVMYQQGLLDRQEFLSWIVETVEKCKYPDDPIMRLILLQVMQYLPEFTKSELLSRKLSMQCAKKITYLVNETDAICTNGASSNEMAGAHPVIQAFVELMDDSATRFVILGLSNIIQSVTLECPASLVWNYFGENKTPSSLLASPLDYLPNCSPSGLPMPPRQANQSMRHRLKQAETLVKERSMAAEAKWSGEYVPPTKGVQSTRNVNLVLSILEELDSYVFERTDSSQNCLESLYSRLFSSNSSSDVVNDDILIHTLCDWAVTSKRSGEHRAFVVAKLLEMRQSQLSSGKLSDENILCNT